MSLFPNFHCNRWVSVWPVPVRPVPVGTCISSRVSEAWLSPGHYLSIIHHTHQFVLFKCPTSAPSLNIHYSTYYIYGVVASFASRSVAVPLHGSIPKNPEEESVADVPDVPAHWGRNGLEWAVCGVYEVLGGRQKCLGCWAEGVVER